MTRHATLGSAPRLDAARPLALATLAAAVALLVATGRTLPSPPPDPLEWASWWAGTDPALAVGALLRVLALAGCGYLFVLTAADLVASLLGLRLLSRLVHRLAPAAWRTVVLRPMAVGVLALPAVLSPAIAASPVAAQAAADDAPAGPSDDAGAPPDDVVITMSWQGDPTTSTTAIPSTPTTVVPPTTATTVAPPASVSPPGAVPAPPAGPRPAPTPAPDDLADHTDAGPVGDPAPTAPPADGGSHRVVAGESFWSIAADEVRAALGRAPSAREVAPYWRELVRANADRLPVAGNPDLIFPGMLLRLPPPR